MDYTIWLNGEYVPRGEAKISMLDRGFRLREVSKTTSPSRKSAISSAEMGVFRRSVRRLLDLSAIQPSPGACRG